MATEDEDETSIDEPKRILPVKLFMDNTGSMAGYTIGKYGYSQKPCPEFVNLQDLILDVNTNVAGVKTSVKNLRKNIEASAQNTPENADGNTDEKKTENGTETNTGTASGASAENVPQQ